MWRTLMGSNGVHTAIMCFSFSVYPLVDKREGPVTERHLYKALMGAHVGFAVARVTRNTKLYFPFWLGVTPTACAILYVHNQRN